MSICSRLVPSLLAASLAITPVASQANDLLQGMIGGVIGGVIVNEATKNQRRTTTTTRRVYVQSNAQRQENREVQTALNYFNFPAGAPDGVLGRRSREAIHGMQVFLQMPSTGQLDPMQKNILLSAHARALSGAPDIMRLIATSPLGTRAALQEQKDLMFGGNTRTVGYPGLPLEVSHAVDEIAESSDPTPEQLMNRAGFIQLADLNGDGNNDYILDTSYSGSTFWCRVDRQCKALVFASTPSGYVRNDLLVVNPTPASFRCIGDTCTLSDGLPNTMLANTPAPPIEAPAQDQGGTVEVNLPKFGAPAAPQLSLANHCNTVNLLSATRGGFVTEVGGGKPEVILSEQFCLARGVVVAQSNAILEGLGVTQDQANQQCQSFGPAMKAQIGALSLQPADGVINEAAAFIVTTGMSPDELKTTARICLGAAYQSDDMDIAIGSAILMVALGEQAYSELLGHHLMQGFGATERKDLALEWYDRAFTALNNGAVPVFAGDKANRKDLLIWAVKGGSDAAFTPIPNDGTAQPVSLPKFGSSAN